MLLSEDMRRVAASVRRQLAEGELSAEKIVMAMEILDAMAQQVMELEVLHGRAEPELGWAAAQADGGTVVSLDAWCTEHGRGDVEIGGGTAA